MKFNASIFLMLPLLYGGCAMTSDTFLEDALVSYKRAFVSAQERIVLEELAKYEIWGETVALLNIASITLEPQTKLTRGSKKTTSGEFGYTTGPGGKLGFTKEVTVSNEQVGKISVQLKPSPKAATVLRAFEAAKAEKITIVTWHTDKEGKENEGMPCGSRGTFYQCVPITGYVDKRGMQAYAHIPNEAEKIKSFRKLLRTLSADDQGPFFSIQ